MYFGSLRGGVDAVIYNEIGTSVRRTFEKYLLKVRLEMSGQLPVLYTYIYPNMKCYKTKPYVYQIYSLLPTKKP